MKEFKMNCNEMKGSRKNLVRMKGSMTMMNQDEIKRSWMNQDGKGSKMNKGRNERIYDELEQR